MERHGLLNLHGFMEVYANFGISCVVGITSIPENIGGICIWLKSR